MSKKTSNRRDFAKQLALLAASPLAAPEAHGKADSPTGADSLTELARQRYAKFLNAEQMQALQRTIDRHQRVAEVLKQVKLQNGDEPAFIFSAEIP